MNIYTYIYMYIIISLIYPPPMRRSTSERTSAASVEGAKSAGHVATSC